MVASYVYVSEATFPYVPVYALRVHALFRHHIRCSSLPILLPMDHNFFLHSCPQLGHLDVTTVLLSPQCQAFIAAHADIVFLIHTRHVA